MRWVTPHALWLLLLLPLIPLVLRQPRVRAALRFPSAALVRAAAPASRSRARRTLVALRLAALAAMITALAHPQQGLGEADVEAQGIDIVLALDVSGSMRALDFTLKGNRASRLDVVRSVVKTFIEARPNDRIGMVAFAGRPYLVAPLTLDHDWLEQNLDRVEIGLVEDGTAVGSAIASSTNRLRDRTARSRVVVLLTDGVNNAGKVSPTTAAEAARALGIRVYTIAAGTKGEAPMPVRDAFGLERIMMVPVDVDEESLKQVADLTGGAFFRATDTDSLERIYQQIDEMEKSAETIKKFDRYRELYPWLLVPALLLLGLEIGLGETRLRRLP
jgi:Ca-activated chloride channel family protein